MILCVCLSPALDVTYHVDRLDPSGTTRVRTTTERPGGKGVNVARVLHRLDEPTRLIVPAGGATGEELALGLAVAGPPTTVVATTQPTRRTVTVVTEDGAHPLTLVEPALIDCWSVLFEAVETDLAEAEVLVISGSTPDGVPDDGLALLVEAGRRRNLPVVVDTHGPHLVRALEAGASQVKPNAHELCAITGDEDPWRAARSLADSSGAMVVASLGADGIIAAGPAGTWEARPGSVLVGNPTGAGDALVAGLARGLRDDPSAAVSPERMLRDAVALSAAAVLAPVAGELDLADYQEQLAEVVVLARDGAR